MLTVGKYEHNDCYSRFTVICLSDSNNSCLVQKVKLRNERKRKCLLPNMNIINEK